MQVAEWLIAVGDETGALVTHLTRSLPVIRVSFLVPPLYQITLHSVSRE